MKKINLLLCSILIFLTVESFCQNYKRIISLSPNITEILYSLNAGDRIAGVTDFCDKKGKDAESVGGVLNPNIEKIISLKPDLIISLPAENLKARIEKLNLEMLIVKNEMLDDIFDSINKIGKKLQKEPEADKITGDIKRFISSCRERTSNIKRKKVLFIVSKDINEIKNLYAAGRNTFLSEIIEICGGENIIVEENIRYPKISVEEIIKKDPDIIFDTSLGISLPQNQISENFNIWKKLNNISAVKSEKVIYLNDPHITIPGTNIKETIIELGKYINPEIFNE